MTNDPLSQHGARKEYGIVPKVEIRLHRHSHPFNVNCSCPSGSTEHERLGLRNTGPGYDVYAQRTPGAGGLPSEIIVTAIAIIRYMSGTTEDPKSRATDQNADKTSVRAEVNGGSNNGNQESESEEGAAGDDPIH